MSQSPERCCSFLEAVANSLSLSFITASAEPVSCSYRYAQLDAPVQQDDEQVRVLAVKKVTTEFITVNFSAREDADSVGGFFNRKLRCIICINGVRSGKVN